MKITDGLAIYGAALSTIVFLTNTLRSLRRVRVHIVPGTMGDQFGYWISIANHTTVPMHIRAIGVLFPNTRYALAVLAMRVVRFRRHWRQLSWVHGNVPSEVETGLPAEIAPGNSISVFIEKTKMHAKIGDAGNVAAYVQDALSRNFYSKPMRRLRH